MTSVSTKALRDKSCTVSTIGPRPRIWCSAGTELFSHGEAGPEPPRPTDPDPGEPDQASQIPDPATGFVIDPAAPTGPSDGMLKLDLLGLLPRDAVVPREVRDDADRAARTHPGGTLLPAAFMVGEQVAGQWRAGPAGPSPTPQGARDALAGYLRVMAPWQLDLDPGQRAVYDAAAEQDGTRLTIVGDPEVLVTGDRDLIFDAIANLEDNAIKHGRAGGQVVVANENIDGKPVISIADDGSGIPADQYEHVFKRFYRLEHSRGTPGNGLGLSLVAAVARLHGARIEMLDNSPGLKLKL